MWVKGRSWHHVHPYCIIYNSYVLGRIDTNSYLIILLIFCQYSYSLYMDILKLCKVIGATINSTCMYISDWSISTLIINNKLQNPSATGIFNLFYTSLSLHYGIILLYTVTNRVRKYLKEMRTDIAHEFQMVSKKERAKPVKTLLGN